MHGVRNLTGTAFPDAEVLVTNSKMWHFPMSDDSVRYMLQESVPMTQVLMSDLYEEANDVNPEADM